MKNIIKIRRRNRIVFEPALIRDRRLSRLDEKIKRRLEEVKKRRKRIGSRAGLGTGHGRRRTTETTKEKPDLAGIAGKGASRPLRFTTPAGAAA
ncbi:MAG TPA: hypothetical protein PLN10_04450 [Candidatus Aminicenantes bacterium]|jgi:hypothetical protein|nr:hypothetical protein [Candidatus Aminicenantes bacterium]